MKVIHVVPKYKLGGVETAVFNSIVSLRDSGIDFKVLAIEACDLLDEEIKHVEFLNSSIYSPLCAFKFIKHILNEKPDIIVYSLWKSSYLAVCLTLINSIFRLKYKTVTIIHNTRFAHFMDKFFTRLALKLSDNVFFDSQKAKEFIANDSHVNGEVISFIDKKLASKDFDFNKDNIRFVYIGRIHQQKNLAAAIHLISFLKNSGLSVSFDIYGPDEGELKCINELIIALNLSAQVSYCGMLNNNDVNKTLKGYDFYLQLSFYEGMAMSVVDALQVGVIPLVTGVGEISNYLVHRHNGLVFDVNCINDRDFLQKIAIEFIDIINSDGLFFLHQNAVNTFKESSVYSVDYKNKIISG